MEALISQVRLGQHRAIARLITRIENSGSAAELAVTGLYADTGRAHAIGITGSPGSGKSTLVNALAKAFRRLGRTVAIIAVDPSSPFTGGAVLGDRVRMRDLSGDKGIFIRSMASRGKLGGLSQATAAAAKVMDAAGFDVILIETVGAGQAEVDIASTAHTTLVIEAPGMGDDIQSIKAGILEIADILVVNKADRPGASRSKRALEAMLQLGHATRVRHHGVILSSGTPATQSAADEWQVPVLETVSTEEDGIEELAATIIKHRDYLRESGEWFEREKIRSRQEIEQLLQLRLMNRLRSAVPQNNHERLVAAVAAREMDPYAAAAELFDQMSLSI